MRTLLGATAVAFAGCRAGAEPSSAPIVTDSRTSASSPSSHQASSSQPPPAAAPVASATGSVLILLPGGGRILAELADDPEKRRVGLMYRSSLPPHGGMLLAFPESDRQSIWMKNCLIPLDLIWLDSDGRALAIQTAPPCKADPCPSYSPEVSARYVLEIEAGAARREGLGTSSKLEIISIEPLSPR